MSQTPTARQAAAAARQAEVEAKARAVRAARIARRVLLILASVGIAAVWLVDLYASYLHGSELALRHGQPSGIAHTLPIGVDGLMLGASMACLAMPRAILPRVIFAGGALATIAANVLWVQDHDVISYGIAGITGGSLIASAVILERMIIPQTTDPRETKIKDLERKLRAARKAARTTQTDAAKINTHPGSRVHPSPVRAAA